MTKTSAPLAPAQPAGLRPAQMPGRRRFRTPRVILALILREIGAQDAQSSLGFLWSVIDPIATVAILSVTFSLFMHSPRLGTNFPLYYVTGIVVFHLYSQIVKTVAASVRYSSQLLGFPAVTVFDALMARFILHFLTHLVVFIALSAGVIFYYDLRINLEIGPILTALAMASALGLGFGAFNSVLFMLVPAYENLWNMATRPLAIASGTLILIEDMPDWLFNILWWNPAAHFVAEMRRGFYPYYDTSWVSPGYVFLVSAIALAFGLVTLHRWVYDALER